MATWYLAKPNFNLRIEEVEVVSETPAFVTLKSGRKKKKVGKYGEYFKDREDAKACIIRKKEGEISDLLAQIEQKKAEIEKANAL